MLAVRGDAFLYEFSWHNKTLADSSYLCQKPPLAFWPIPFLSEAFVPMTRCSPQPKDKIRKICHWLQSHLQCGTED